MRHYGPETSSSGKASMSFDGRQSWMFADFVLITDRSFVTTFDLSTDSALDLHGTIHIPNATLSVSGSGNKVADQSPCTVLVANHVSVSGSASLVINSNYNGSGVPVPSGVGSNGSSRLTN